MEFLLITGMLVSAWVFLCVLSGERERRVVELETRKRIAVLQAAKAARDAAAAERRAKKEPEAVTEV